MPAVNITVSVESGGQEGTAALLVPLCRGATSHVSIRASLFMSGVEGRRNQSWSEEAGRISSVSTADPRLVLLFRSASPPHFSRLIVLLSQMSGPQTPPRCSLQLQRRVVLECSRKDPCGSSVAASFHLSSERFLREPLTRQRQLFQLWFGCVCGAEPASVRG